MATDGCALLKEEHGPGIPVADRQPIYEPFVRLFNITGSRSGLSVAWVVRIVDRHRGTMSVADFP